jgi:hypothetical protein
MNAVAVDLKQVTGGGAEVGFSGYVHGIALVDLLQIFHYSRRSLTLHIEPNASIHVADGEIVHARVGEIEGELAISCLLDRTGGRIRTDVSEVVPTTIQRPFNFLLLDALRGMDEAHKDDVPVAWPEESGEFMKEVLQPSRGSLFPSVPAAGNQLLASACVQLADRVENTRAVALVDLKERRVIAQCGSINRALLEEQCLAAFERPQLAALDRSLSAAGRIDGGVRSTWLDEVRYIGQSGAFFGKTLTARGLALVLCACCEDAPGLAWAELRQSVRMVERILP